LAAINADILTALGNILERYSRGNYDGHELLRADHAVQHCVASFANHFLVTA
jgi:hypothetical protein